MQKMISVFFSFLLLLAVSSTPDQAFAKRVRAPSHGTINSRSAILVDMGDGRIIYEQNPDATIAPASITKVLTLYIVFEALREGRLHSWENVHVSSRAAQTGGSRMGLKTGHIVAVEELVKGMAVVSGNDACVAIAEHMSGTVEEFVRLMNNKARELGMSHSHFTTPNGLPAPGQYTTARDIAKLSVAYLRRFPESLNIHSMQSYTYRTTTHRNANRLLATCPGVDGLKTGFVCAAGYNLSATCKRGETRLLAVVLGAPSAGVRATETSRLLEMGYQAIASGSPVIRMEEGAVRVASERSPAGDESSSRVTGCTSGVKRLTVAEGALSERHGRGTKRGRSAQLARTGPSTQHQIAATTCAPTSLGGAVATGKGQTGSKVKAAAKGKASETPTRSASATDTGKKGAVDKKVAVASPRNPGKASTKQREASPAKEASKSTKSASRSSNIIQGSDKPPSTTKPKKGSSTPVKKGESGSTASAPAKKKSTL